MAYQAVDEIMARCEKDGVEFWKAVQLDDCEENGISEEESWNQMTHMWNSMKESVAAYDPEAISRSGLVGREGKLMDAYREQEKTLCGDFVSKVIANALKMGCNNACMKRIVAAPTAGLHFTRAILNDLKEKGVHVRELTLHVGAGTFRPVKAETIGDHDMHTEHLVISRELVEQLKEKTGDIVAVGTTSVRTLESLYWMGVKRLAGQEDFFTLGQWEAYTLPQDYSLREAMEALCGWFDTACQELLKARTTIIIVPGYRYRVIDAMFTNFHQPQSTLLLLVGAAVGEDWHKIYDYALTHDFRFLSYGDSSLLEVKKS